jgi:nitronate monooxygenase
MGALCVRKYRTVRGVLILFICAEWRENMFYQPLRIADLFIPVPIVQGGMGVGVSLAGLASAVAKAGGLGVISAAQIGFDRPGFAENPLKVNLEALCEQIKLAKNKVKEGVIGVNIMVALNEYAEYVKAAAKSGADIIFSGAGLPMDLPKLVEGTKTKIVPIMWPMPWWWKVL